jgi:hypothetical protein
VTQAKAQAKARMKTGTKPGAKTSAKPGAKPGTAPSWLDRHAAYVLLGIVLVAFALYARTFGNGFIDFDDPEAVTNNPWISGFSGANVEHWFSSSLQFMYTPLVLVSYAIDHALGGTDPAVYHVTNLMLHLVNVTLVYLVTRALTRRTFVALFTAGAFAIHPVNVDGVAWVATRSNLLATGFMLGSLLAYSRYAAQAQAQARARRPGLGLWRWYGWRWYGLCLALFVAATFSKSAAVVLPVVLLLWDYAVARRISWTLLVEKLPLFAVSVIMGLVGLHLRQDTTDQFSDYTLLDRGFVMASALWAYVVRVLLPYPLSFAYAYPAKDGGALPWWVYLTPLLLAGVVAATFFIGVPRRIVVFGWAFFVVTNVLSQTVLLIDNYKPNRYAYLPFVGLFIILGWALADLLERFGVGPRGWLRWTALGLVGGFAVWFCLLTVQRAGLWKDTITLLEQSIEHEPDVAFVYNSRAIAKHNAGDPQGAIADVHKVLELDPNFNVYNNLGTFTLAAGDAQGAVENFTKALERDPHYLDAYSNRAVAKLQLGDKAGACADWTTARDLGLGSAAQALVDNAC